MSFRIEVEVQGNLFKAAVRGRLPVGGGQRGRVKEFSPASRKRLIDKVMRLETDKKLLFATFTYEDPVPGPSEVKRHLDLLEKRLVRRFLQVAGVWRFGIESSGQRDYHPHLHIVLFNLRWLPVEWLEQVWKEVTGGRGGFVWVELVGWRRVLGYLSRYMARVEQGSSLDYMAYLTGEEWPGRWWGLFNRSCLPWGDLVRLSFAPGPWFWRLKRCGRHVWGGVNSNRYAGFTLFRDNPGRWLALCVTLAE
jgi:hypothetical protein